jgi:hypothetical protein
VRSRRDALSRSGAEKVSHLGLQDLIQRLLDQRLEQVAILGNQRF